MPKTTRSSNDITVHVYGLWHLFLSRGVVSHGNTMDCQLVIWIQTQLLTLIPRLQETKCLLTATFKWILSLGNKVCSSVISGCSKVDCTLTVHYWWLNSLAFLTGWSDPSSIPVEKYPKLSLKALMIVQTCSMPWGFNIVSISTNYHQLSILRNTSPLGPVKE